MIPITLGLSGMEEDGSDWEELIDYHGNPTGIERRSFRLNVVDGHTESIDEEWDRTRRLSGIFNGTNTRREVDILELAMITSDYSNQSEQESNYHTKRSGSSEGYLAECSDTEKEGVHEHHLTYTGCLNGTHTTLSTSTSGVEQNTMSLGSTRTTLSASTSDMSLGSTCTTLSASTSDMSVGSTRTTLSASTSGMSQDLKCLDGTRTTLSAPMNGTVGQSTNIGDGWCAWIDEKR